MHEQIGPEIALRFLFPMSVTLISKRKSRPFINISLLCPLTGIFSVNWFGLSYLANGAFAVDQNVTYVMQSGIKPVTRSSAMH